MKFKYLALLSFALTLSSCASVNSYQEPQGNQSFATVSGSSSRSGLHVWSNSMVTMIDDKAIGMQWSENSKTKVTPGTHHFVVTTEFNQGWGTGPYNGLTEVVANLKPGMNYRFVAKAVGASLNVWAEDSKGQRASAVGVSKYQIESPTYMPIIVTK